MRMPRYDQYKAVKEVYEILKGRGMEVSYLNQPGIKPDLVVKMNGQNVNVLVRHLEVDGAYKNSPLPYNIYKVEAFKSLEELEVGLKTLEIVIGYNFAHDCFACIPISEYEDKKSVVVHEREGNRSWYYQSLEALGECGSREEVNQ